MHLHTRPNWRIFLSLAALSPFVIAAQSTFGADDNWPQWRGPLQSGAAPKANPPLSWSETSNIKWKVKIPGAGNSTPIIWDKQVFVQTAIPTGKKIEAPKTENADQGAPPPARGPDDPPPARGPAGPGGPGGPSFGPGMVLSGRMLSDADKNKDQKLSRDEFATLATTWFDKLDSDKAGKLDQEKFTERFGNIIGPPPEGAPEGRRGGPERFIAPGFFRALDADKNGNVNRDEFSKTFDKWFTEWDTEKSGALSDVQLRDGLNAALPRPQFGGPGGRRGFGGRGGEKPTEVHQFALLCLDRDTGKVLWQQIAKEEVPHEAYRENEGSFASPSGLTDGQHVFGYFGSRGLYCFDMKGQQQWSKDLGKMRIAMGFGEGSSLAQYKDSLIVNWDNEDGSYITVLDKKNGNAKWKETRDEGTSWSTPLIVEHGGKVQIITSATSKIRSYDLSDGKLIWECKGLTRNVIPSPVADKDMVYCMSGFMGNALLAIRLDRTGDLSGTDAIAWTYKKSTPYVPAPLLYNDKLYFFANNNGVLTGLEARTGKPLIDAERIEGLQGIYASPIGAAGRIYLLGRNGATVVLKESDKLEILATNRLDDKFDASPAAVGKDLFLRGKDYLYAIAEK